MIRAVVFDVDGVVVRSGEFARILASEHGASRDITAAFFQGPFLDCVVGRADLPDAIAPYLDEWGWTRSVADLLAMWFEADSAVDHAILGVVAGLRRAGYRCAVASTQERHRAEYLATTLGLAAAFDDMFFSCHVGARKPERAFYEHVAAKLSAEPAAILFLDDHEPNVAGAREAGWNAELYTIGDDVHGLLGRYGIGVA